MTTGVVPIPTLETATSEYVFMTVELMFGMMILPEVMALETYIFP